MSSNEGVLIDNFSSYVNKIEKWTNKKIKMEYKNRINAFLCENAIDNTSFFNELFEDIEKKQQEPDDFVYFGSKIYLTIAIGLSIYHTLYPFNFYVNLSLSGLTWIVFIYFFVKEVRRRNDNYLLYTHFHHECLKALLLQEPKSDESGAEIEAFKDRIRHMDNAKNERAVNMIVLEIIYYVTLFIVFIIMMVLHVIQKRKDNEIEFYTYWFISLYSLLIPIIKMIIAKRNVNWLRNAQIHLNAPV